MGVGLIILDLGGSPLDTRTGIGRFTLTVLAAVNRLTRDFISEATSAKLQALKADGVRLGAPPKMTPGQVAAAGKLRAAGMPMSEIGELFNVSVATLYRAGVGKAEKTGVA